MNSNLLKTKTIMQNKSKFNKWVYLFFLILTSCSSLSKIDEVLKSRTTEKIEQKGTNFILEKFLSKKENPKSIFIFDPLYLNPKNLTGIIESGKVNIQSISSFTKKYELENSVYNRNYLISYLVNNGFNVFTLNFENYESLDLKKANLAILEALKKIRKESNINSIHILGVSLGGQVISDFIGNNLENGDIPKIEKLAYIGTGFDYNYTGSLSDSYRKGVKQNSLTCNPSDVNNLCNKYITSIYYLEETKEILSYPKVLIAPEKGLSKTMESLSKKYPTLIIYGKLDAISPEESIYPPFYPEKRITNQKLLIFEASTANALSMDYDHFDLFLNENAIKEIFPLVGDWFDSE